MTDKLENNSGFLSDISDAVAKYCKGRYAGMIDYRMHEGYIPSVHKHGLELSFVFLLNEEDTE